MSESFSGEPLHAGFLRSAARHPEALALWIGDRRRTYAEVEDRARRWASALGQAVGDRPGRVGIFAYRSEVSYVGVLASLFSGAGFVPLNRTFPAERTRRMIELADLDAIIVDQGPLPALRAALEGLPSPPPVLFPEGATPSSLPTGVRVVDRDSLDAVRPLSSLPEVAGDDLAYLLFTSGSTGQPKGVPIAHANVDHFLRVNQARYRITPEDRLSQTFDQTFDLSVFDQFMAWGGGACVCPLQPMELLSPFGSVRSKGITVWFSVPSVAALLLKKGLLKPGSLPGLRRSLFCGEPLTRAIAEAWQAAAPDSIVENLYGPTELTIACSVYRWDPRRSPSECVDGVVPIGRVYETLHDLVVDEDLRPVADGEPGELCVAGPQTFAGYWRAPDRTAASTLRRHVPGHGERTFYRTGDRVRRSGDGHYLYVGRADHQVKVHGYRVELGEVEAALRRDSGVVEAVALGWPTEGGTAQGIIAFVSGRGVEPANLTDSVRGLLPTYMVPRAIHAVDAMPLNSNGKIDRIALRNWLEKSA
jgi:amino acid adenylation domain-containing protein